MSLRVVFAALASACVAASLWNGLDLAYSPDGLPTWDPASYLLNAVRVHDEFVSFDVIGVLERLTRPDVHPPLHAVVLGAWLAVVGNTMDAARAYPVACFVVSLGLLTWIGRRAVPGPGLEIGLAAAVLTALGSGHLELLTSPLTESTGMLTQFVALGLAVHLADRRDARAQLAIGVAIFVATLVRFNMGPMLLAPLYLHHAWRYRGDRAALLDPRTLLWAAPTLVGFAVWQVVRPDLFPYVLKFFENRSSGLPFWSAENLLFVPRSVHAAYLPGLGIALFASFLLGLSPRRRTSVGPESPSTAGLGRLQAFVLVAFAALTLHDYKITRNLATTLPVFYLCALAPLARLRLRGGAAAGVAALLALCGYGVWQHTVTLRDLAQRTDFQPDPVAHEALRFIERHAGAREQAWVIGGVFRLSPDLVEYWLRAHRVTDHVRRDQPLFGTQTRTGVEAAWSEEYLTWTRDTALAPEHRDRTTYVTIETVPGSRYYDAWKAFGNHYARAFAEQTLVPEVDRLEFVDEGLTLRVYRLGDAPSAATLAARDTGPSPEDDVDVVLPEGVAPLARETFGNKARAWTAYPPGAPVELVREGSALVVRVSEPHPSLQVCNTAVPAPAPAFTAVLNASTKDLKGSVFVHFRGMGEDGTPRALPDGAPDITHAGPLSVGPNVIVKPVVLGPSSAHLRVCFILERVTGTLRLEDLALFEAATVVNLPAAGAAPSDAVSLSPGAWKLVPGDVPGASLAARGRALVATVEQPVALLQACGPTVPWKPPMTAAVAVRGAVSAGKSFVHLRALDADAVLLRQPDGRGAIEHIGPITGPNARVEESRPLQFPDNTALVRPCIVLDDVAGSVALEALAVTTGP